MTADGSGRTYPRAEPDVASLHPGSRRVDQARLCDCGIHDRDCFGQSQRHDMLGQHQPIIGRSRAQISRKPRRSLRIHTTLQSKNGQRKSMKSEKCMSFYTARVLRTMCGRRSRTAALVGPSTAVCIKLLHATRAQSRGYGQFQKGLWPQ